MPFALGAGVQPLLHVHALVFEQSGGVSTELTTISTHMGRELRTIWVVVVGMLVSLEMQGAVKALATVRADVGLPPSMGALVSIQVGGPPKALAAVPAGVGPLACVNASMSLPVGAPRKTEPTLPTVVRLIGGDVKPSVLSQLSASTEALPAFPTTKRLISSAVETAVAGQLRPPPKTLPTV